jgi:hypothetical protein
MPQSGSYLKLLAGLLPAGALGISSALASTADAPHRDAAAAQDHAEVAGLGRATAEQLQQIRAAVSAVARQQGAEQDKVAWWYFRNYWPNFRNYWPNWGNYWRNW